MVPMIESMGTHAILQRGLAINFKILRDTAAWCRKVERSEEKLQMAHSIYVSMRTVW